MLYLDPESNLDVQDEPPGYDVSVYERKKTRHAPDQDLNVNEAIPHYSCSVSMETPAEVHFEQGTPFDPFKKQQWTQVYVVLSGTLFRLHSIKKPSTNLITMSSDRSQAGRLLKTYSMQHAEVGIAADEPKQQLIPKSPYIAMLPEAKIEKLKVTEPHLFDVVRRYFVRIRVEGEQLLFRLGSSEDRSRWIDRLCAAVDIAPPIEDRTEPKYHTLPRRRRRRPPPETASNETPTAAGPSATTGLSMNLQTGFPMLSPVVEGEPLQRVTTTTAADPDPGDIDESLAFAGAELSEPAPVLERVGRTSLDIRRIFSRRTATNNSNADELTSPASPTRPTGQGEPTLQAVLPVAKINTKVPARIYPDDFVKWQPQFFIDSAQQIRYRRHCMPSLLYNSKRANDIVVHQGKRWKIDWDSSRLLPWPEAPPTYQPPKVMTPAVPIPVVQNPAVADAIPPTHGTATTSLSDAGVSTTETAETAATSATAASQAADSAPTSIHAGDGNIEGWNWSCSRAKLSTPSSEHPALSSEIERHDDTSIQDATGLSETSGTPRTTPHTLRRTGHLHVPNYLQEAEIAGGDNSNLMNTADSVEATPLSAKSTDRSSRRSFQLFSKPARADFALQDASSYSGEVSITPAAKQKQRLSYNMIPPFSGRASGGTNTTEIDQVSKPLDTSTASRKTTQTVTYTHLTLPTKRIV